MARSPLAPALLAFAAVLAGPAAAVDDAIIAATAGRWLVAPEAGGKGCILTLDKTPTLGGYALSGAEACDGAVAALANAASWHFGEGSTIVFADATRRRIVALAESENGTYRQAAPAGKALVLLPAAGSVDRITNARDLFGTWTMRRPTGETLCAVTLLDRPPPGGEESYGLTLAKTCDAAILRLKLASWRIEGLELVLYGTDGASLAFAPLAEGGFAKAEREGGKPLRLTRR